MCETKDFYKFFLDNKDLLTQEYMGKVRKFHSGVYRQ